MTGHLLRAAGAVEAIVSVMARRHALIPPTANYVVHDPDCDLDYVPNLARSDSVNFVMTNSVGFGGHNASLVFRRMYQTKNVPTVRFASVSQRDRVESGILRFAEQWRGRAPS